jgi:iron complex outermembrane receptor protein
MLRTNESSTELAFKKALIFGTAASALVLMSVFPSAKAGAQTAIAPTNGGDGVQAPQLQDPNRPSGAIASTQSASNAGEILVTGSRVVRDGSQAPTPITSLSADTLAQSAPSNIPDALNKLPQFVGSSNQYSSRTYNATVEPQGNFLNLRGLGPQRALVLLDGMRLPPSGSNNAVDTNTLPQLLISRVDTVTGGASAVYGSDAVSGVVNFVLNKNFDGVTGIAQNGISTYGDGESYRVGVAAGTDFADKRGHIEFSIEHYDNKGIPSQADRPYYKSLSLMAGTGVASDPYVLTYNTRLNNVTFGGLITSGPLAGQRFNNDGTLTPFVHGAPTGLSYVEIGGDGAYVPPSVLVSSLNTDQAFGRVSFDVTPDIQVFAQGSYTRSHTSFVSADTFRLAGSANGSTIFADNPYLSPAVTAALGGTQSFQYSRFFDDLPPDAQNSVTQNYLAQAGATGSFGRFKWDVGYEFGRTTTSVSQYEQNNRDYFAAIDAVDQGQFSTGVPNGNIVCRVTLVNPSLVPGCKPLNIFGNGNANAAAIASIYGESKYRILNQLQLVNANIHGDLFDLPAGAVTVALGGEVRWQKLDLTTNSDPSVAEDYTGIRGVPANVADYYSTNVGSAFGKENVKEVYGEVLVPLLKDKPFVNSLDVTGAGRYTDYSVSGSVATWKAGVNYSPVEGVRFRGTLSRDIAAPSLYDLFAGPQSAVQTFPDPHTGVAAQGTAVNQGNPNLKPEKARTAVVGVVLTPKILPGFTFSVDAYRIKINGALNTSNIPDELRNCEASNGTAAVCNLIVRPHPYSDTSADNFPTYVIVNTQNLASLTEKGIDFEASYRLPLSEFSPKLPGALSIRAFVSYLATYDTRDTPTSAVVHRAGALSGGSFGSDGLPKWRGTLEEGYNSDGFNIEVTERFTGKFRRYTAEVFQDSGVAPNRVYTDLYISQRVKGFADLEPFIQVSNLFNVKPPFLGYDAFPGFTYPTEKSAYDVVGRYFTAGVKFKF